MPAIPTVTIYTDDGPCVINACDFVEGVHSTEPPKQKKKVSKRLTKKKADKK